MKLPKELWNGCIIFIGIAVFFITMSVLGLANLFYLRVLNVLFVFYGVNRTIKMNFAENKKEFVFNATSAMTTSIIGVVMSVFGLAIYSYLQGGDSYVQSLSKTFLFGGSPSIVSYSFSLLIEGIASSVIVTLLLMLYWNNKLTSD